MNTATGYKKTNMGKTTKKYISYMCDVINEHNLQGNMQYINWKDKDILSRYYGAKNDNALKRSYGYMIKKLQEYDILAYYGQSGRPLRLIGTAVPQPSVRSTAN